MSRRRLYRGIKRITTFFVVISLFVSFGLFSGLNKKIINFIKYPEFRSSMEAYIAVYGDDNNRLKELDKIAKAMGYDNFNDYRVKTW